MKSCPSITIRERCVILEDRGTVWFFLFSAKSGHCDDLPPAEAGQGPDPRVDLWSWSGPKDERSEMTLAISCGPSCRGVLAELPHTTYRLPLGTPWRVLVYAKMYK